MKRKAISVIFTVLLLSAVFIQPTHANSAQRHWSGTDSTGALVKDKNCPLVVDKELLTFDVQEFPNNYYNSTEEFLAYTGKVTAEYTFRNPADYTVNATLVFPFGNLPHYGEYIYDSPTDKYTAVSDTEKYGVKVNGKLIKATVRHTLKDRETPFSLDEDMPKLTNGYIADNFFRSDLPVWVQQYSVEGIGAENQAATAAFVLREDSSKTRVLWEEKSGIATLKDGIRMSGWTKTGDTLTAAVQMLPGLLLLRFLIRPYQSRNKQSKPTEKRWTHSPTQSYPVRPKLYCFIVFIICFINPKRKGKNL